MRALPVTGIAPGPVKKINIVDGKGRVAKNPGRETGIHSRDFAPQLKSRYVRDSGAFPVLVRPERNGRLYISANSLSTGRWVSLLLFCASRFAGGIDSKRRMYA